MKKVRFYMSLTAFLAIVAAILFVKLPYTVVVPLILELRPDSSQYVYIPEFGGTLEAVYVKPGQEVKTGEKLAKVRNMQILSDVLDLQCQLEEANEQLAHQKKIISFREERTASLKAIETQIKSLEERYENRRRDFERLTLLAPIDGTVVSPPWKPYQEPIRGQLVSWWGTPLEEKNLGVTFESAQTGTVFCSVGDPKELEAVLVVNQSKISFVREKQKVELKFDEFPNETFKSEIGERKVIESSGMDSIPPALSTRGKGEVPTTTKDGVEVPSSTSHRILVPLDNSDGRLVVGMTGSAKIHVDPQSLFQRIVRLVSETFTFALP